MNPFNLVDDSYELIDPNPNIHELFILFDQQFFWTALSTNACIVEWSKRMTSCAGICQFNPKTHHCSIRLSEPLLKLRKRRDLIDTLLHEMIHAYIFLTGGARILDRDGHGPDFQSHMHRINSIAGTSITIYHSFHAEVSHYKQHWWRCTGPCKDRAPYYGWVKRANNRAPGAYDYWWKGHQASCNGTYVKVKEPEKKEIKKKAIKSAAKSNGSISSEGGKPNSSKSNAKTNKKAITNTDPKQPKIDEIFKGNGHVLGIGNQVDVPGTSKSNNDDDDDDDDDDDFPELIFIGEVQPRSQLKKIDNKPTPPSSSVFSGQGYRLDGF